MGRGAALETGSAVFLKHFLEFGGRNDDVIRGRLANPAHSLEHFFAPGIATVSRPNCFDLSGGEFALERQEGFLGGETVIKAHADFHVAPLKTVVGIILPLSRFDAHHYSITQLALIERFADAR